MPIRILDEADCRNLVDTKTALEAIREAFIAFARGHVAQPATSTLDLVDRRGEFHIKGAYLHGSPFFSFKAASGFYGNPALNLPVSAGLSLAFDSRTGFLSTIMFDNGFLTDVRTGAAGALAVDLLAKAAINVASVIGAGGQARFQVRALLDVRRPRLVRVYSRSGSERYAQEMAAETGLDFVVCDSAEEAIRGSDLVITTTPSRDPYLRAEWLEPGAHVNAIGADLPLKRELYPEVLARADKVVTDWHVHALEAGELHHAVDAGLFSVASIHADLGEVAAGIKPGREHDDEVTIADLTGLGFQDAALAGIVASQAFARDLGRVLTI